MTEPSKPDPDKSESKQDTENTDKDSKFTAPPSRGRTFGAAGTEKRG